MVLRISVQKYKILESYFWVPGQIKVFRMNSSSVIKEDNVPLLKEMDLKSFNANPVSFVLTFNEKERPRASILLEELSQWYLYS